MSKGTLFTRNGWQYEVLQDGVDFIEKQKSCIRPQGEKRCIDIEKALKLNLIRKIGRPSDSAKMDIGTLLPLSYVAKETNVEELDCKCKEITEHLPTYDSLAKFVARDENTFYMPVDELRAQVFLAHGLIYPAVYDKAVSASNFNDIQRDFPTALTLFRKPYPIKKKQLLLKLLLQPDEVEEAHRLSGGLQLSVPLPISRLTGIGISSEEGELPRYVAGWIKPDVPVPSHLFAVTQADYMEENILPAILHEHSIQILEINDSIRKFDRYMGLIAFLRNAGRYFSRFTGYYSDYPEAFFSLYDEILRNQEVYPTKQFGTTAFLMALMDQEAQLSSVATNVLSLVTAADAYIEKERARLLAKEIYIMADENEEIGKAFHTLFSGDYRSAIRLLQQPEFPLEARILAVLFKFSSRQSNDHRTIKQRLHEDWAKPEQVIPVLGTMGAYYGYTALDAKETSLYSVHPLLKTLVEQNPEIKFHLHTSFERQLIETLYQRAFFHRVPDNTKTKLYEKVPTTTISTAPSPPGDLVKDQSYRIHDLFVRRYKVTTIGTIIQYIRDLKADYVDERTELGRYLLSHCFFLADEFEISRKSGKDILRFRITKNRLETLLIDRRINVNYSVIKTAIEEDIKKSVI